MTVNGSQSEMFKWLSQWLHISLARKLLFCFFSDYCSILSCCDFLTFFSFFLPFCLFLFFFSLILLQLQALFRSAPWISPSGWPVTACNLLTYKFSARIFSFLVNCLLKCWSQRFPSNKHSYFCCQTFLLHGNHDICYIFT